MRFPLMLHEGNLQLIEKASLAVRFFGVVLYQSHRIFCQGDIGAVSQTQYRIGEFSIPFCKVHNGSSASFFTL